MILRKAKLEDFEIFKKLYEDEEGLYQFLYNSSIVEDSSNETDCSFMFDESIAELCSNYTIEQFKENLETSSLIYMIEDSSEVIGYISIFYCGYGKYKVAEWSMFNTENDTKKVEVLNCLKELKLSRFRILCISTVNKLFSNFLISNGFYSLGDGFFKLEI